VSVQESERTAREAAQLETQLSSLVWICTSTHATSRVTVLDANNPADILESFTVCNSHLLCITSVPGNGITVTQFCMAYFVCEEGDINMSHKGMVIYLQQDYCQNCIINTLVLEVNCMC
jgi:hypothetical protein